MRNAVNGCVASESGVECALCQSASIQTHREVRWASWTLGKREYCPGTRCITLSWLDTPCEGIVPIMSCLVYDKQCIFR